MFHYIKAIILAVPSIIYSYFAWMIKFSKHPEKYPLEYRCKKVSKLCKRVMDSYSSDYKIVGKENLPHEASFLVCNHLSMFDPVSFLGLFNEFPLAIAGKIELEHKMFIGKCIKCIDGTFIDRDDIKKTLKVMMKIQDNLTNEKNKHWLIYPEGTRNKDVKANVGEFHHGTFRPAFKSGVPIVPCCVYGTFRTGKVKPSYKRYPIYIEIGKPLYKEDYKDMTTEEIAKYVHNEVSRMLTYNARKYDEDYMFKYNKKTYLKYEK